MPPCRRQGSQYCAMQPHACGTMPLTVCQGYRGVGCTPNSDLGCMSRPWEVLFGWCHPAFPAMAGVDVQEHRQHHTAHKHTLVASQGLQHILVMHNAHTGPAHMPTLQRIIIASAAHLCNLQGTRLVSPVDVLRSAQTTASCNTTAHPRSTHTPPPQHTQPHECGVMNSASQAAVIEQSVFIVQSQSQSQ